MASFNRNQFRSMRVGNANTGLQLEEAGTNTFYGCAFENVAYGDM
jgi:hypothetical protein